MSIISMTTDEDNTNAFVCAFSLGILKSEDDDVYLDLGKAPISLFEEFEKGNLYLSLDTKTIGTKEEIYESYRNEDILIGTETDCGVHPCDAYTVEEMFDCKDAMFPYLGLGIYTYEEFTECSTQTFICKELFKNEGYVLYGLIS